MPLCSGPHFNKKKGGGRRSTRPAQKNRVFRAAFPHKKLLSDLAFLAASEASGKTNRHYCKKPINSLSWLQSSKVCLFCDQDTKNGGNFFTCDFCFLAKIAQVWSYNWLFKVEKSKTCFFKVFEKIAFLK